jgi:hypothetical protein
MFFQGDDRVHQAMRRVAGELEKAGIRYAIIGGMAVNAHRHERTTKDVDFLLTAEGLAVLRQIADASDFEPVPGRPRRFVDRPTGVTFDVLVAGRFPGNGEPGPIAFPDPATVGEIIDGLRVVHLPSLVQLKLAAGRHQDFADVISLIRANKLDERFAEELDASIRADYIQCFEDMRREDEYESRRDLEADEGGTKPSP